MSILFLTTGGTIDKDYMSGVGVYDFVIGEEPAISRIFEKLELNINYNIQQVMTKDSLEMDDSDREKILSICEKAENDKIIITHGTDSMIDTAEKLSKLENKLIILVGSARPEVFKDTDADFNIGCAVAAVNCLSNGVFIAMNGNIYNWNECKKDNKTGNFINK